MNLDELVNIGNQASDDVAARAERQGLCPSGLDMGRARVRAIVTALREEMTLGWEDDRPWGDVADVNKFMNKILASDGVVAAGGSARKDETYAGAGALKVPVTASAPAAAPVCEWTHKESWIGEGVAGEAGCDGERRFRRRKRNCPSCGKPIKFKSEAAR